MSVVKQPLGSTPGPGLFRVSSTVCGFCPQLPLGCKMGTTPPSVASEFRGEEGAVSYQESQHLPQTSSRLGCQHRPRGLHSCTHFRGRSVEVDTS